MCMLAGCGRPESKSEFPGNAAKPPCLWVILWEKQQTTQMSTCFVPMDSTDAELEWHTVSLQATTLCLYFLGQ